MLEIYENLARRDLHYIDRGSLLNELKKLREKKYPDTKPHIIGTVKRELSKRDKISTTAGVVDTKPKVDMDAYYSFSESVSRKVNIAKSTIREDIQIAESITSEVKNFIKEKKIPKNLSGFKNLSDKKQ